MRRENKLALIVGFSVLLVVAVLVSDHLSQARQDVVGDGLWSLDDIPKPELMLSTPLEATERVRPEAPGVSEPDRGASHRVDTREIPAPAQNQARSDRAEAHAERVTHELLDAPKSNTRRTGPTEIANGPTQADRSESRPSTGVFDWQRWAQSGSVTEATSRSEKRSSVSSGRERAQANRQGTGSTSRVAGHVAKDGVYIVQDGDTLTGICQKLYGDGSLWRQIADLNKDRVGEKGQVYVGVRLKLPTDLRSPDASVPERRAAQITPNRALSSGARNSTSSESTRRYTVQKGDTLSLIASREVGSVRHIEAIKSLNASLREKDMVFVGQRLTLPVIGATQATTRRTDSSSRSSGTRTYTVKAGDTLGAIAQRELGSSKRIEAIRELNASLKETDRIVVGQRLTLPASSGRSS